MGLVFDGITICHHSVFSSQPNINLLLLLNLSFKNHKVVFLCEEYLDEQNICFINTFFLQAFYFSAIIQNPTQKSP